MILWLWTTAALAGDKDGDGVPNKTDACREEPEDIDGFQDEDGCPDPDNDGDGVEDVDDKCPDEPEDADGHDDADGCPDPDDDGDGVLDAADVCPLEKEDGKGAADGCPDVSLELLTNDGYLAAVGNLMSLVVEAAGQAEAGCETLAFGAKGWLQKNDVAVHQQVWEARMKRAPEGFDAHAAEQLLRQKADVYRTAKPAVEIFCKDNAGWTAVAAKVDAVFEAIPPADPPPKKKKGR